MNPRDFDDLSNLSMLELFRVEAETQTALLTDGLLQLERGNTSPQLLETLMRAAHSIKGAARIVNLQVAVRVAHAMEDCFVAAQKNALTLTARDTDVLLRGVDLLGNISKRNEADIAAWEEEHAQQIEAFVDDIKALMSGDKTSTSPGPRPSSSENAVRPISSGTPPSTSAVQAEKEPKQQISPQPARETKSAPGGGPETAPQASAKHSALAEAEASQSAMSTVQVVASRANESPERVLRLGAENLNRLLGLAGESLVESRWLRPFADSLQRLKRHHVDLAQKVDELRTSFPEEEKLPQRALARLNEVFYRVGQCQQLLADRMQELDLFDRRSAHLSHRLYLEVLRTRMRPFGDGVSRFPRMVRDLGRSLGKFVRLEIAGENTQVDRDILERLETPLAHLLRNAVDHGCETPEQRERVGKPRDAVIRLEARHSAGMLLVTVADDGGGINLENLRQVIVQRKLTTISVAEKLNDNELLEFLFLPGFTLKETVTEISGRGVGLDVVQNMVKSVRGNVRISTQAGRGVRFQLHLPLTLSVLRTLLVDVGGEPYAIPLSQIARTLKLPREKIEALEGRHHFQFDGQQIGLLTAHQVLDCGEPRRQREELAVVVLGERNARYGLVVDRFLGERELVVQPLDSRLGKVKDISAAALMEDGAPVLILDVEDMVRSIEKMISGGLLARVQRGALEIAPKKRKRILAVDDSLTVRELERKLLSARGYLADVAVDGMDGWNAVRSGHYDLVITDVDMPRLDGIELAALIKKDPNLKSLPVMIVSYKDREEDRLRGLEAGADYYLTKGSFHDETLLQAVVDLIGEPEA